MFAGTGMKKGDRIPGLIGWEYHGNPPPLPGLEDRRRGDGLVGGGPQNWTATIYPGPKGNFVFNASTIFWVKASPRPRVTPSPGLTGRGRTVPTSGSSR